MITARRAEGITGSTEIDGTFRRAGSLLQRCLAGSLEGNISNDRTEVGQNLMRGWSQREDRLCHILVRQRQCVGRRIHLEMKLQSPGPVAVAKTLFATL